MKQVEINSWLDYFSFIDQLAGIGNSTPYWTFRGQGSSDWTLKTSFKRILDSRSITDPQIAIKLEMTLTRYFLSNQRHFKEFSPAQAPIPNLLNDWARMQHYGAPTRLLDWTDSPTVALYYAVEGLWESDGAVFVINNKVLEEESTKRYGKFAIESIWDSTIEKTFSVMIPTINSRRSYYQQGLFTVSRDPIIDHLDLIGDLLGSDSDAYKLVINKTIKLEILRKLRSINVKADILYPDEFGLGRELNNLANIRLEQYDRINKVNDR